MITLFPNTGIQYNQLEYDVLTEKLQSTTGLNFDPEYLIYLLKREWTPISFNGNAMDYARIYWRFGIIDIARRGSSPDNAEVFSPLLAFDTTTGKRQYGQLDEAIDVGKTFESSRLAYIIPNQDEYFRGWLTYIHERKKQNDPGFKDEWADIDAWFAYKEFLRFLVTQLSIPRSDIIHFRHNALSKKHLAGEISYHSPVAEDDMNVNIYLDYGNSRSTCLFVEENVGAHVLQDAVYPLEITDYDKILNQPFSPEDESEEYIFDSRVQFRESMFQHQDIEDTSHTFRYPSIVCVGKEAAHFGNKSSNDDKSTGMSAPKRYLWDNDERSSYPWHFSNGRRSTINGKMLEYFEEYGVDRPPTPKHSRSRMTTFFIIEILNQAFTHMNSHKHRLNNETQRRRRIKRLVLTYPSGWTRKMKDDLLLRAQEGANKFTEFMNIPEITVELGLDEASASQVVFLESQIRVHDTALEDFGRKLLFENNKSKFRVASIDIGGGTTDMMIAEYDMNSYQENRRLRGEILHVDGTATGGDDIVKRIIEEYILPQLMSNSDIDEKLFNKIFLGRAAQDFQPIRLRCMNILLRPICHELLASLESGQVLTTKATTLYEFIQDYVDGEELKELALDLKNGYDWDIKIAGSNLFTLPSHQELCGLIKISSLKGVLDSYSKFISKFKPSFILLTGKISSIDVFRDIVQSNHPAPSDRIIQLGLYAPGDWYPYLKNDRISDAKTTVVVGMALSDIARHLRIQEGCNVYITDSDTQKINFLGLYEPKMSKVQITDRHLVFTPELFKSKNPIKLSGDVFLIYRNLNDEKLHCGTLKKIGFKGDAFPNDADQPSIVLARSQSDYSEIEIVKDRVEGSVNLNGEVVSLTENNIDKFIYIKDQTLTGENYFLDTGKFQNRRITI
jgi:hypothetical protein